MAGRRSVGEVWRAIPLSSASKTARGRSPLPHRSIQAYSACNYIYTHNRG